MFCFVREFGCRDVCSFFIQVARGTNDDRCNSQVALMTGVLGNYGKIKVGHFGGTDRPKNTRQENIPEKRIKIII